MGGALELGCLCGGHILLLGWPKARLTHKHTTHKYEYGYTDSSHSVHRSLAGESSLTFTLDLIAKQFQLNCFDSLIGLLFVLRVCVRAFCVSRSHLDCLLTQARTTICCIEGIKTVQHGESRYRIRSVDHKIFFFSKNFFFLFLFLVAFLFGLSNHFSLESTQSISLCYSFRCLQAFQNVLTIYREWHSKCLLPSAQIIAAHLHWRQF